MIIDAHIHYTPPDMVQDLAAYAEREPYWGLLITPDPVNHTEQGWATAERMIEDMDKAGIDKSVLLTVYRNSPEGCREANDETIAIVKQSPDRVTGFCVFHSKPFRQAIDEVKRCVDAGLVGVGELNPYAQGLRPDDPDFLKVVEAMIDLGLPMNLHVSEEVGHYYLGKTTTPMLHYYQLVCRFPELKLILAHWGGGLLFFEIMPEVRRELQNVYYDTAGSPLLYPTEAIFRMALNAVDHRKILYGSDYPLIILPKQQQEPDFRPFLAEIDGLVLDPQVKADILGNNMARVLGYLPDERARETVKRPATRGVITEVTDPAVPVDELMAVAAVAQAWQATRAVFDRYGIAWQDSTVPFWEPIVQAAATHGLGPKMRQVLLKELQEAISGGGDK